MNGYVLHLCLINTYVKGMQFRQTLSPQVIWHAPLSRRLHKTQLMLLR